jgi:hypothetical protein
MVPAQMWRVGPGADAHGDFRCASAPQSIIIIHLRPNPQRSFRAAAGRFGASSAAGPSMAAAAAAMQALLVGDASNWRTAAAHSLVSPVDVEAELAVSIVPKNPQ